MVIILSIVGCKNKTKNDESNNIPVVSMESPAFDGDSAFAFVAARIPIYPANAENTAPIIKAIEII